MSRSFVILHKGVDEWSEGEIVPEDSFAAKKFDIKRLLSLKAIREADSFEVKAGKATIIHKEDTHATYETRLIEKDKTIADLKIKITQMEAEIQALHLELASKKPQPVPQSALELIAEKEKQIQALKAGSKK